jgi:hypothetical protein
MRRSTALMSVAAVAFMASNAFAQAKPNFAGTWNMVVDSAAMAAQQAAAAAGGARGGRGGGARGGFGPTFSVTQDANTLTITRTMGQMEMKQVYKLDGSDSPNATMGRGGEMGPAQISKAKWDGNNLVIVTTQTMGETTFDVTRTISLDAAGSLWIETSAPSPEGPPRVSKVQYKKG